MRYHESVKPSDFGARGAAKAVAAANKGGGHGPLGLEHVQEK